MAQPFIVAVLEFNHFGTIAAELEGLASKIVRGTSQDIAKEAEANTPPRVDTGHMMGGWWVDPKTPLSCEISNHQDYAIYNELGTSHMAPHPMLTPAAEHNRQPFMDRMARIFK